jgi:hypothetical protein
MSASQRQIQLHLLSHFCVLPDEQLQLATELLLLLLYFYHSVRAVLQNSNDSLFRRSGENVRQHHVVCHDDPEQVFTDRQGPCCVAGLVTVAKLEFKWVIRASVLVSVMMNIYHGWEYEPIEDWLVSPVNGLRLGNTNAEYYGKDYSYSDYSQAFYIYVIVYFMVDFVLFLAVNTSVEVMIVLRMRKEMREKRERLAKMHKSEQSASQSSSSDSQKREQEDWKKERRVIVMVILNGAFNFVLRAPGILVLLTSGSYWSFFIGQSQTSSIGL